MRALLSAIGCLFVLSGANAWAAIEVPPGCKATLFTTYGYQSGYTQGISLTNRAWTTVGQNCDRLEVLSAAIIDNLQSYTIPGTSPYLVCRHTGMVSAIFQRLDEIWQQCQGDCCLEGEAIGALSAELYCQLSILLDGLAKPDDFVRLPVFMCGMAFETCCDAQFINMSFNYQGLNPLGQQVSCAPLYTTDSPYYDVWEGTRKIQCNYTPPPDNTTKKESRIDDQP